MFNDVLSNKTKQAAAAALLGYATPAEMFIAVISNYAKLFEVLTNTLYEMYPFPEKFTSLSKFATDPTGVNGYSGSGKLPGYIRHTDDEALYFSVHDSARGLVARAKRMVEAFGHNWSEIQIHYEGE